ncbi:hypothetical protein CSKR_101414 [Clonorchis sinensis]|uniref:Uncharacterized protein n=2 Tax=Clonorchis sinensis TaxID=79923 RepID=A0A8T1MN25_CLOSI|nr:hypothetical protein CSKR_101414 [Clonorchis sinensis]GAA33424.2 zinc finger protein 36 C3H1 type-like 1 [Clonorchis sinensis]
MSTASQDSTTVESMFLNNSEDIAAWLSFETSSDSNRPLGMVDGVFETSTPRNSRMEIISELFHLLEKLDLTGHTNAASPESYDSSNLDSCYYSHDLEPDTQFSSKHSTSAYQDLRGERYGCYDNRNAFRTGRIWHGRPQPGHDRPRLCQIPYKTELCRRYLASAGRECAYGSRCRFAHGLGELRLFPYHPRHKTELCRGFHEGGRCIYGKRCIFIHNESKEKLAAIRSLNRLLQTYAHTHPYRYDVHFTELLEFGLMLSKTSAEDSPSGSSTELPSGESQRAEDVLSSPIMQLLKLSLLE